MNDEELMQELLHGNTAALEMLVHRYHSPLYAYLFRMLGAKTAAEDAVQECFVRVIKSVRRGRLPDTFRPWLYKIASNYCRDLWRKSSFRNEWPQDNALLHRASDETVVSIFEKQADRESVIGAIGRLTPGKRDLIVLRFYQELKLEEIAAILDIPLSTVKSRLYQSLSDLHRLLSDGEPDTGEARAGRGAAALSGKERGKGR